MLYIENINLNDNLSLFSQIDLSSIDSSAIEKPQSKIIQYHIDDASMYIKTIYQEYETTKYNNRDSVIYRYNVDDNGICTYNGYELIDVDGNIDRYTIDDVFVNKYDINKFDVEEFNVDYLRRDEDGNTLKFYYYRMFSGDKDRFITFIQAKELELNYTALSNAIDMVIDNILEDEYFMFKYSENNCFSLYIFK